MRDAVLSGLADMVNLLRATGGTLIVNGHAYRLAEDASTVGKEIPKGGHKDALADDDPYYLPPVSESLARTDPPPAVVVQVLRFAGTLLGGVEWPDGDRAGLDRLKDAFTTAATAIIAVARTPCSPDAGGHRARLLVHRLGQAARQGRFPRDRRDLRDRHPDADGGEVHRSHQSGRPSHTTAGSNDSP